MLKTQSAPPLSEEKGGAGGVDGLIDGAGMMVGVVATHVETRRTVFSWLVAATFLPALVTIGAGMTRTAPPLELMVLLFGVAHVPTTFGLYVDPALRPFLRAHRGRAVVAPVALVLGGALVFATVPGGWLPYLAAGVVFWQLHHFAKQNLGVVAFWCRANGLAGSDLLERRLIVATGVAGMLGIAPYLDAYSGGHVPWAAGLWSVGRVLLVVVGVVLVARSRGRRVPVAAAALFYAPLFLFPHSFEAAVMGFVVAHGAQYYLMVGHLVRGWVAEVVALFAVVGYLVLSSPSSAWMTGAVSGVAMAHFVVDAGLWRMRDPERRAYLRERFAFL